MFYANWWFGLSLAAVVKFPSLIIASRGYRMYKETTSSHTKLGDEEKKEQQTSEINIFDPYVFL